MPRCSLSGYVERSASNFKKFDVISTMAFSKNTLDLNRVVPSATPPLGVKETAVIQRETLPDFWSPPIDPSTAAAPTASRPWDPAASQPNFESMLEQIRFQVQDVASKVLPPGVDLDQLVASDSGRRRRSRRFSWVDPFGEAGDADSEVEGAIESVAAVFGVQPKRLRELQTAIPRDTLRWSRERAQAEVNAAEKPRSRSQTASIAESGSRLPDERTRTMSSSSECSFSEGEPPGGDSDWAATGSDDRRIVWAQQKLKRSFKAAEGRNGTTTAGSVTTSDPPLVSTTFGDDKWPSTPDSAQRTKAARLTVPTASSSFSPVSFERAVSGDSTDEPTIKGVYFDRARKLWRANWKENGRVRTKGFSVAEHGNEMARELACEHRLRMEVQHSKWNASPSTSESALGGSGSGSAFPAGEAEIHSFPHHPLPTASPQAPPTASVTTVASVSAGVGRVFPGANPLSMSSPNAAWSTSRQPSPVASSSAAVSRFPSVLNPIAFSSTACFPPMTVGDRCVGRCEQQHSSARSMACGAALSSQPAATSSSAASSCLSLPSDSSGSVLVETLQDRSACLKRVPARPMSASASSFTSSSCPSSSHPQTSKSEPTSFQLSQSTQAQPLHQQPSRPLSKQETPPPASHASHLSPSTAPTAASFIASLSASNNRSRSIALGRQPVISPSTTPNSNGRSMSVTNFGDVLAGAASGRPVTISITPNLEIAPFRHRGIAHLNRSHPHHQPTKKGIVTSTEVDWRLHNRNPHQHAPAHHNGQHYPIVTSTEVDWREPPSSQQHRQQPNHSHHSFS
eukprot:GHVN01066616.1.p1 GENE.GHVN01066616.1~~GHVN01066616.1.p1  ORF type:complete len:797 (+),score=100.72 GHVN01066616.1:219-2609(+)